MNSRKHELRVQVLQLIDSMLILLAFWLATIFRGFLAHMEWLDLPQLPGGLGEMGWLLFIVVPLTPIVLENFGFYDNPLRKSRRDSLWQMFQAMLVMSALVAVVMILLQLPSWSRIVLVSAAPIGLGLILLREAATKARYRRRAREGSKLESVLLVGQESELEDLKTLLPEDVRSEWEVVGTFDLTSRPLEELVEMLHEHSVSRVVFSVSRTAFGRVQEAVRVCEIEGVEAWVHANFLQTSIARPSFDSIGGQPMLVFRTTPELSWALLAKELMDRIGAFVALLLTWPLWVFAAVGLRITSPRGPVFFRQERAGRHGRPFTMLKFRTMVPEADSLLDRVKKEHGNQMSGPVFKLEKDPRVLPFGSFLRRLSIDELPQLWNVLMGDMSLVGPRPLPLYEVEAFADVSHRRRLSVKPGITCYWQAGGRNEITSFEEWVEMDLRYIDNWSLWLDIRLILKTIPAVLFGRGAK